MEEVLQKSQAGFSFVLFVFCLLVVFLNNYSSLESVFLVLGGGFGCCFGFFFPGAILNNSKISCHHVYFKRDRI